MDNSSFLKGMISWHKLAFDLQLHVNSHHSYSSKWYTWPFMYKPLLIFWQFNPLNKQITSIIGLGNPIIWWSGILAILFQIFLILSGKGNKIINFLVGTYFIAFLPYAFIPRPMFLYHYLPALFILILILEYTFVHFYTEKKYLRPFLISWISLVVLFYFYLYPLANGYSLSSSDYKNRLLLNSWKKCLLAEPIEYSKKKYHAKS